MNNLRSKLSNLKNACHIFRHYLRWPYPMYKPSQGLSQILCKRRNAVQIEQNLFKAEVAQAAAALFSK